MGDQGRPVASPVRGGMPRRIWFLIGVVATLVAAVLLVAIGRPVMSGWARQQLVEQARTQGIILHLSTVNVSPSSIQLENVRAELEGVPGVTASIQSAEVSLTRFQATRIKVAGTQVSAVGAPLELMRSLQAWRERYAAQLESNVTPRPEFKNTRITWQATPDGPAFLQVDDVEFASDSPVGAVMGYDWSVTAKSARAGTYVLQPLALALHLESNGAEVGFGAAHMQSALVRGGWRRLAGADDFHVSFEELSMGPLLVSLSVPSADPKLAAAQCKGGISLRVPQDERSPYTGRFEFHLRGWVPPHPPELDGFAFGSGTKLQSMLEIDRALTNVRLTGLDLSSGELRLSGHGLVRLVALASAHLQAELKGQLPCSALASAMAESKLGKAYGQWVARNAGRTVEGQVDVTVQIDADSNRPDQAKVTKLIGVGCGLRPLSLHDMLSLGLPPPPDADFLKHAAESLPKLDVALPKLPPMPNVKWPTMGQPR